MSKYRRSEPDRGLLRGACNIRSCQRGAATWFNVETKAYYCGDCARTLNDANRRQAQAHYGHDLILAPWHHLYAHYTKLAEA